MPVTKKLSPPMLSMVKATILVDAPKAWSDAECAQTADKVNDLVQKLENALQNGLREIDPALRGRIE